MWEELEVAGAAMSQATQSTQCSSGGEELEEADSMTFETWVRRHVVREEGRAALRSMCRGMIAQEPSQVSFLSILKSMKGVPPAPGPSPGP